MFIADAPHKMRARQCATKLINNLETDLRFGARRKCCVGARKKIFDRCARDSLAPFHVRRYIPVTLKSVVFFVVDFSHSNFAQGNFSSRYDHPRRIRFSIGFKKLVSCSANSERCDANRGGEKFVGANWWKRR
ncbi:MAG: hypothetical protein AB7G15_19690 [Alphaproteobacteria bacterium]